MVLAFLAKSLRDKKPLPQATSYIFLPEMSPKNFMTVIVICLLPAPALLTFLSQSFAKCPNEVCGFMVLLFFSVIVSVMF